MKYLKCLKLRPEMECKLSENIWFTKDGLDFLEKVFGNAVPRIYPHIGVFERCKEVCTDCELEYDHTYIHLGNFCVYKNTYRIELRVGHQTRMMFEVWHQFGDRWYRLVDKVGKNYVSNRYDGGDGMMSDVVMDFLDCIWEDVCDIHELHKGRELNA